MEATAREGPQDQESSASVTYLNRQGDWLEKTRGNLVVAATVIATMSFQIMVNPPGGVWQSDNCSSKDETDCKRKAGTSILEHDLLKRGYYVGMVISSVMSFSASMNLILLVISGFRLRNRLIMGIMVLYMMVAVLCISTAFYFAVALIHYDDEVIQAIQKLYLVFWLVVPAIVFLVHIVRFLWWCICWCLQSRV